MIRFDRRGQSLPLLLAAIIFIAGAGLMMIAPSSITGQVIFGNISTGGAQASASISTSEPVAAAADSLYLAAISMAKSNIPVTGVGGLGLNWTRVKAQCSADNKTQIEVWSARGTPAGDGVVTANLSSIPSHGAVILVSRYSQINLIHPIGAVASANARGLDGACGEESDDGDCDDAYDYPYEEGGCNDDDDHDVDNDSHEVDGSKTPVVNLTMTTAGSFAYGAIAIRDKNFMPGTGYTERAEAKKSKAGAAVEDRQVISPSSIVVNGTLNKKAQWAIIAIEILNISPEPMINMTSLGCTPLVGNFSDLVMCTASVQTTDSIDIVAARITLPNGSVIMANITNASDTYAFSMAGDALGSYAVSWTANNTAGNRTNSSDRFFIAQEALNCIINNGTRFIDRVICINSSKLDSLSLNSTNIGCMINFTTEIGSVCLSSNESNVTSINSTSVTSSMTNSLEKNCVLLNSTLANVTCEDSQKKNVVAANRINNGSRLDDSSESGCDIISSSLNHSTCFNSTLINNANFNSSINHSSNRDSTANLTVEIMANITNATLFNSTVINSTATRCRIRNARTANSACLDSNVTDSRVNNSLIDPSDVDDCDVHHSIISDSTCLDSTKIHSMLINSTANRSYNKWAVVVNSTEQNITATHAMLINSAATNSTIANSTFVNGSIIANSTLDASRLHASKIINSTVINSTVTNCTIRDDENVVDAILTDCLILAVFDLAPANATAFNVTDTIMIAANVTNGTIDRVLANVTDPDGITHQVPLSQVGVTERYNASFTIPDIPGEYIIRIIANDSDNTMNTAETTRFIADRNFTFFIDDLHIAFGFIAATFNNTFMNSSLKAVQLMPGTNGTFISQIFNLNTLLTWRNISWVSNEVGEMGSGTGFNTSDQVLLFHFNNDPAFGENSTAYFDFSPSGNNASCVSPACPAVNVPGKIFSGVRFDGLDDLIEAPASASLGITGDMSLAFWINVSSLPSSNTELITYTYPGESSGTNTLYELQLKPDGDIRYKHEHGAGMDVIESFNTNLVPGAWYHIAFIRNATSQQVSLFLNGSLIGAFNYSASPEGGNGSGLAIGGDGASNRRINATMDELAIWSRPLRADDMRVVYLSGMRRLDVLVRSCDDAFCSGENFTDIPDIPPQNLTITDNPFIQYMFVFGAEDGVDGPRLFNVTIDPEAVLNITALGCVPLTGNFSDLVICNASQSPSDITVSANVTLPGGSIAAMNVTNNSDNHVFNMTGNAFGRYAVSWEANDDEGHTDNATDLFFIFNTSLNCDVNNATGVIGSNTCINSSKLNSTNDNTTLVNSTEDGCTIVNSILTDTSCINSTKYNVTASGSSNLNSTLNNTFEINSTINNSFINNSRIENVTANNATLLDCVLINNASIDNSVVQDCVAEPPVASSPLAVPPSPAIYDAGLQYDFQVDWTVFPATIDDVLVSINGTNYTLHDNHVTRDGDTFMRTVRGLLPGVHEIVWIANDSVGEKSVFASNYTVGLAGVPAALPIAITDRGSSTDLMLISAFLSLPGNMSAFGNATLLLYLLNTTSNSLALNTSNFSVIQPGHVVFTVNKSDMPSGSYFGIVRVKTDETPARILQNSVSLTIDAASGVEVSGTLFLKDDIIFIDAIYSKHDKPSANANCTISIMSDSLVTVVDNATMQQRNISSVPHFQFLETNWTNRTGAGNETGKFVGHVRCVNKNHPNKIAFASIDFEVRDLATIGNVNISMGNVTVNNTAVLSAIEGNTTRIINAVLEEVQQTRQILEGLLQHRSELSDEAVFLITDSLTQVNTIVDALDNGELDATAAHQQIQEIQQAVAPLISGRAVEDRKDVQRTEAASYVWIFYVIIFGSILLTGMLIVRARARPPQVPPYEPPESHAPEKQLQQGAHTARSSVPYAPDLPPAMPVQLLKGFIRAAQRKGWSREAIVAMLESRGWPEALIEHYYIEILEERNRP